MFFLVVYAFTIIVLGTMDMSTRTTSGGEIVQDIYSRTFFHYFYELFSFIYINRKNKKNTEKKIIKKKMKKNKKMGQGTRK